MKIQEMKCLYGKKLKTPKIILDNKKDGKYIQKLIQVPTLFSDFKIWMDRKLHSKVHRLQEELKLLNLSLQITPKKPRKIYNNTE